MSEIWDDKLIRQTPIYSDRGCTAFSRELVITKEEFLLCYNEWVLKPMRENPISTQTEFFIPADNGGVTPV